MLAKRGTNGGSCARSFRLIPERKFHEVNSIWEQIALASASASEGETGKLEKIAK
jgi:hypothetical protein